jgi:hypothetical protein
MRAPMGLAGEFLRLMRHVCADPDLTIGNEPVQPLVQEGSLCRGHRSGVAVDLAATRMLIESLPHVAGCTLEMRYDGQKE